MLKVINTKVLIAILAVLTAIAGLLVHEHDVNERNAAAAAKAAAILQQQQKDADAAKKADEQSRENIQRLRRQHNSNHANESKGWQTYVP